MLHWKNCTSSSSIINILLQHLGACVLRWSLDSTCFDLSDLVRTVKPIEANHNSAVCDMEPSLKAMFWKAPLDRWFDSYKGRAVYRLVLLTYQAKGIGLNPKCTQCVHL